MNADRRWMDYALRLGRRALGTTAENPPVGCVLVRDGRVLGVGWTQPGGRPHAETEALKMAGERARGATAYVTLEPCAHHGRTGPCAEALVMAGVARVVTAIEDPDPRVSGRGHAILRAAGVAVELGAGAEEARHDLAGFLMKITKKRPYVTLKIGVSADGKIAAGPRQRTTITGPEVKARVYLMRAQSDAILVGLSTVLIDDPELTCRLPGMEARSPIRIVADTRLSIPSKAKLVKTAEQVPVWILSTRKGGVSAGITVIDCRQTPNGWVDFADALEQLATRGINRLLVEGGSHISQSLLEADLVDEVHLFQNPVVIGPQGIDAIAEMLLANLANQFRQSGKEVLGTDTLTVYERPHVHRNSH
ncbi:MAG: bifunctional diaminohydroxyphosphoribosylaminopyrimidine deaminase/5-amino-6-(5-phosphoribosylamino)uracil reductase RibD [Aestuariivirga sp.]